jgi:hypothetical protein
VKPATIPGRDRRLDNECDPLVTSRLASHIANRDNVGGREGMDGGVWFPATAGAPFRFAFLACFATA